MNARAFRLAAGLIATFALGALVGGYAVLADRDRGLGKVINTTLGSPADADYSMYWEIYSRLESEYVGEADRQKLLYGAIRGTVDALGDPYSLFLDPEEAERFFQDIEGEFSGIGAEINQEGETFVIVAPLPDSPAESAGLKAKDVIVSVDGKDASEFEFGELINAIRGKAGTEVKLGIFRDGAEEIEEVAVTRDTIELESVEYEARDGGVAVIRLTQFSDDTLRELTDLEDDLERNNTTGIVLDLRNNPGGYLDASVDIASLFVKDGPIVIEQNKAGERKEFPTTLQPVLSDYKLVVLINDGSASASEIVAGAVQDRKEGTIVGTKSFGKGSVQEVDRLDDGSALRLTIAKWLTPDGRAIDHEGIKPDVEVNDDEGTEADEQLDKAIEELRR